MTSDLNNNTNPKKNETEKLFSGPSKSQVKRDCNHLVDLGEDILKLKPEQLHSLDLPDELQRAVATALKIKSRSGLKRQRQYIGKILRSLDNEAIESQVKKIQHSHDTNTAQFKRLEKWRDNLVNNDRQALNDVITHFPEIDRQRINQLIRAAQQEKERDKPPAAARKLFSYLRELEDSRNQ